MRALVTGGNRGIGLATAQGLASRGLEVVLGCRDVAGGEAAAAGIPGATCLPLDLADGVSVARALAALGPVDVLVNNAGVCPEGKVLEVAPEVVRQAFEAHVFGPLALIRGVLPGMLARGYGRIVNLSSGWGSFGEGLSGPFAYSVSKAALDALTLSIGRELSGDVKINACCPGWVATRMGGPGATRTPEQGADTPIWLATLPPDGPNGGFFRNREPIPW
ncbi:SDR family NAD(P)-dependent oxidoreductase [Mesoterricola silvestris]|uniref:20-beta-hydroxysteroid dehydrogenase n=1 Tax=Mesoterricola silvestris TaxID=2927979 RepID=A0AA48GG27_9BACT|nr:SDR family NAD(P)-dependent oxidoreductase [Mesoterricola silvestris]BDU72101.1 20-beta-hydroxysteroid dehydrogenase [Mesoterricola silvestris]